MVWFRRLFTGEDYKAVILIAIMMNELALADKYESLQEVAEITPKEIDRYARFASAALCGYGKYGELPKAGQTDHVLAALIAGEIAAAEGQKSASLQHMTYAEAAQRVLHTHRKIARKRGLLDTMRGAEHDND